MKNPNLLLFFIGWMFCLNLNAQISEEEKSMSLGVNNAIILEIPDAKEKFVEKLWKKYIKQYDGKTKRNRKADEYRTENAEIVAISGAKPMNVYCRVNGISDDVELIVWMDMGEEYLSSFTDPEAYTEAEKFLMRFALDVTREKTKIELKDQENKLKKLNKNLKKLERANANFHREIEIAKEKILKAESNIEQNVIDQDETRSAIGLQEEVLEEVRKRLSDL